MCGYQSGATLQGGEDGPQVPRKAIRPIVLTRSVGDQIVADFNQYVRQTGLHGVAVLTVIAILAGIGLVITHAKPIVAQCLHQGQGHAPTARDLPDQWKVGSAGKELLGGENIQWRTEIPGRAWSSAMIDGKTARQTTWKSPHTTISFSRPPQSTARAAVIHELLRLSSEHHLPLLLLQ